MSDTTQTTQAASSQQNPQVTIRNLQTACTELEDQNNWLRTRCAELRVAATNAVEHSKLLEAQMKTLQERIATLEAAANSSTPVAA
jgi:DNA repair exonuclease SbcCD ATPase subunit